MEPVITPRGSGYQVKWDNGVEVYVSRIRENPERLKCEVAILLNSQPLTRSSPVLTSESGKDSLIRKLKRRRPDEDWGIDWEVMVEELSALVVDAHRQGASEIVLGAVPEDDMLTWRVEGVLPEGFPTLLYGDGGSGKSMFATFISVLIDQGYLSTDLRLPVEPGKVLYLDWETDAEEIAKRARGIHRGLGLDTSSGIVYRRCSQPLLAEVDRIIDICSSRQIDVLVCDSLGLATGGTLEEAESTLGFFQAIRHIGLTCLVISHTNKAGQSFGSVYANNSSRMTWEAKGTRNTNGGGIDLAMFHRKANNVALQLPMGWHISFDDEKGVTFARRDVFETDSAGSLSVADLVYQVVRREGPVDKDVLLERVAAYKSVTVDKLRPAINVALSRHKAAGKLVVEETEIKLPAKDGPISEEGTWEL